jgi:hypothetical protein
MSITFENKIYLICKGLSTNDIIDSVNEYKEKKSFFDIFSYEKTNSNVKKEEFGTLDNLGINELLMIDKNKNNSKLINDKLDIINHIYTSLEYSCIESSLIISKDIQGIEIHPLPYLSNKTNIKNKELLYIFKHKFGDKYYKKDDKSIIDVYWKDKPVNKDFLNIKTISSVINWTNIDIKNISSLNSYNLFKAKEYVYEICRKAYIYRHIFKDNAIFITNGKFIEDILKSCREIKYNKKRYTIENSSIWEINLTGDVIFGVLTNIKFQNFKKIYPTEYNYKPLTNNTNYFSYEYNNNKFMLFNSLNKIPLVYLKFIELNRFNENKKKSIKKILNKVNLKDKVNKKNNVNNENNENNERKEKTNKKFKFD